MLVSLSEYANKNGKSPANVRRMAEKKLLKTAQKIGRNWVVDLDESYPACGRDSSGRRTLSVISLFSGCGGLDLGFTGGFDFLGNSYPQTGFKIIWANELSPAACRTYRLNLAHGICLHEGDIAKTIDSLPAHADVIIGGFPCQDISINGKMAGIAGSRSGLYSYLVEAVRRLHPAVFVAENVGSLLLKKHEQSFATILADFRALGYDVSYQLYHAEDYGVPQTRSRVFIVGTAPGIPAFEPPRPLSASPLTAADAIGDLVDKAEDRQFSHIWSRAEISAEQGNRRLLADRPGYTIRAECHGNIQFHYSLPRRISMREAARLQSFPDSFTFPCGLRETERQIGNAVPPVLAWHLAQSVKKILTGKTSG